MKRWTLLLLTLAIALSSPASRYDFAQHDTFRKMPREWRLDNERQILRCEATNCCSSIALKSINTSNRPFTLAFDVRTLPLARPGHWGFTFHTAHGDKLFTWAQPNVGFLHNVTNRKGVKLFESSGGKGLARGTGEAASPWTRVELSCAADSYVMRLGPQVCYQGELNLLGITNLSFHAYLERVELRNIRIDPLVAKPVDSTPDPTFRTSGGQRGQWAVTNVVNDQVGGFVCWMRPTGKTDNLVFLRSDGREAGRFCLYMWDWPRAQVAMANKGANPATYTWRVADIDKRQDEWFHFAFTWNEKSKGRFFINGVPFSPNGDSTEHSLIGNALGDVAQIVITDDNVRDLVVWRRTLTAKEVLEDYRKTMPLDCVMTESLVHAGEPMPAIFRLAPGGTYLRPNPVEAIRGVTARMAVSTAVEKIVPLRDDRHQPQRVTGYRFEAVANGATPSATYDITAPVDISAAPVALEAGDYRLTVRLQGPTGRPYVRHLFFTAAPPLAESAKAPTKDDLRLGDIVAYKNFGDPYRETDARKDARFFEEFTFPSNRLERPYLIEIDWPDDKPRAMGLYMYEAVENSCRDHLQQGLIAGAEIPSSGRIQTARYLFYPATANYLFEARTLIAGRPAAIREVRIYDLPEGLPRLKIHRPEGLPGRTFGHCDEDQTMDNNLTSARMGRPTSQILERLADYFDYTGQNALHYSIMRYAHMNFGWVEGAAGGGMFPRRQGELRELVRALRRRGITFVPQNMFSNDPTIARYPDIEGRDLERKRVLADNDGVFRTQFAGGKAPMNHTLTEEVDRFFAQFMDTFQDLSTRGVDRTLVCLGNGIASPLAWRSWDYGPTNASEAARTQRCAPVTANLRHYVRDITAAQAQLKVTVEVPADAETRAMRGVDLEAVAATPNVELAVIRAPTRHWFDLFRIGTTGKSDALERCYGTKAVRDLRHLRQIAGGALPVVYSYPTYFETFTNLPEGPYRKKYGNYFQNADAKPWGRHFLRELAFCLAETDMLNYAIGMQPLGSWGSDTMVREFTQAYCALPALPFRDTYAHNGVVGRERKTKNGTYFYFVNTTGETKEVAAPHWVYRDLSTDRKHLRGRIALKPYELRSFRTLW